MTPKKAVIIVLVLFLITAIIFAVLYINNRSVINQPAGNGYDASANSAGREELSPVQQKIKEIEVKTNQQVEQIIEQGETANGGIAVDAQQKIEDVVNQEIMEKIKFKTPEQIKADEQRRAELEKIEQQVNQQIKDKLNK